MGIDLRGIVPTYIEDRWTATASFREETRLATRLNSA
jgi:hypothetical protein